MHARLRCLIRSRLSLVLVVTASLVGVGAGLPLVAQDEPPAQGGDEFDVPVSPNAPQKKPVLAFGRGPASLLLSPEEAVQFDRLTTRYQREEFIKRFWATMTRNCPPGVNQTQDLFWKRVEEAKARFADEGISGWRTDRGAMYVLLGEPESVHELQVETRYGTREALIWVYPEREGLPRSVAFLWDRLRWMYAGSDQATFEGDGPEVERLGTKNVFPSIREFARVMRGRGCELTEEQREEMQRTAWLGQLWEAAGAVLDGTTPEATGEVEPTVLFFPAADGATFTQMTLELPEAPAEGSRLVASLRNRDNPEDQKVFGTETAPFETREIGSGGVIAQGARALEPGSYALVVGMVDAEGTLEVLHAGEQMIARMPSEDLALSSVVLARSLRPLEPGQGAGPFRVGGFEVVPMLGNQVRQGGTVRVFYQVLGATEAGDGTVDLDVSYQLHGKAPSGWQKIGSPNTMRAEGAALAWELPVSERWPPTQYRIELKVVDRPTGRSVTRDIPFQVMAR